eukprot:9492255-Prorocentrum_lima.AAC.1
MGVSSSVNLCLKGCNKGGVCMTQIPPYQPRSNGLIERMVGVVKEHARRVLHTAIGDGPTFWTDAA